MQRQRVSKGLGVLAALLVWVLFVLIGYYSEHKPFDGTALSAISLTLVDLLGGLAVVVLAGALGARFLRLSDFSALERLATQAALGALLLGLLWLGLGVCHLYHAWVAWLILLTGLLILRAQVRDWLKDVAAVGASWKAAGKFEKSLAIGTGVLVLLQLILALAPPTKWDALTYHLDLPRHYLAAGYLIYLPQNPYWGHPQIVEMLYTFAMGLNRAQTAAVTGWGLGVVFLLGLVGFASSLYRQFKPESTAENAGWAALAALIAGYSIRFLLGWTYTDFTAALFGLAALIAFFSWLDKGSSSAFRWSSLFAAAAVTVKWTNGVLLLGLFLCLPFVTQKRRASFALLLQSAGIALLVVLPWAIKDFLATGSPLFPYLFPTPGFDAIRLKASDLSDTALSIPIWQRILLPFSIPFTGVETGVGFSSDGGPLLLLFGLPGIVVFWREQKTRLLVLMLFPAAVAIGLLSVWAGNLIQPRIYLAMLTAVALPAGWGWCALKEFQVGQVRAGKILGAAFWMVLAFCLIQDSLELARTNPVQAILSPSEQSSYLLKGAGVYADAVEKVEGLPAQSRLLTLWEPRGFYLPLNAQPDLWIDRFQTDFREYSNATGIVNAWCRQGFTHVLIYKPGERLIRSNTEMWTAYMQTRAWMKPLGNVDGWYDLFALRCQPQ